jgi:predicted small integral membrane protein
MSAGRAVAMLLVALAVAARAEMVVVDQTDGGGGLAGSANYWQVGSFSGAGGWSVSGRSQNRQGYIAQLAEVSSLSLTGAPLPADEESVVALGAVAGFDDESFTVLSGSEVAWEVVGGAVTGVDRDGVAGTATVWEDSPATVQGRYFEVAAVWTWTVRDVAPDNFGAYGGDGLPDHWQVQYFGLDNPAAAPTADPDGNGQDNWFEYLAGTVPTNAASGLVWEIAAVPGQPQQMALRFAPVRPDRIYRAEACTNLIEAIYVPLESYEVSDDGPWRVITDREAVEPAKFYRLRISLP